jgi:hypothetical protein
MPDLHVFLRITNLRGVTGLSVVQLTTLKKLGAVVVE